MRRKDTGEIWCTGCSTLIRRGERCACERRGPREVTLFEAMALAAAALADTADADGMRRGFRRATGRS